MFAVWLGEVVRGGLIMNYTLYEGNCLEVMDRIPDGSVDAIIADLPYGMTSGCEWDNLIPLQPLWKQFRRIIKPGCAIVLFSADPFTYLLQSSNIDWYRYRWIWEKSNPTGHLNCSKRPLTKHEDILVFGSKTPIYYPQFTKRPFANVRPDSGGNGTSVYGPFKKAGGRRKIPITMTYPQSILKFNSVNSRNRIHDTEKPVGLLEYLVKTYTRNKEVVLDCTMGSGTTGVAAMKTGRAFIGIELDHKYFQIAEQRITNAAGDYVLTDKEKDTGQMSLFDLM